MSRSDALKKAQKKYSATHPKKTKEFLLKCHIEHDSDIIDVLVQQQNKNGYIKNLIRQDIKK